MYADDLDETGSFTTKVPSMRNSSKREFKVLLPAVSHKSKTEMLSIWRPVHLQRGKVRMIPTANAGKLLQLFGDKIHPSVVFIMVKLAHRVGVFNPDLTGLDVHGIFFQIPPPMFAYLELLLCIECMKHVEETSEKKGSIYLGIFVTNIFINICIFQ